MTSYSHTFATYRNQVRRICPALCSIPNLIDHLSGRHIAGGPIFEGSDAVNNDYCFFVIGHDRRRILHINVTRQPTSAWIIQQLREAFPYQAGQRFLIFDRDSKYGLETPIAVRFMGLIPVRTSFESPWQNGIAERWVESCRRDLLDHVIAMNEAHLKRLLSEYVSCRSRWCDRAAKARWPSSPSRSDATSAGRSMSINPQKC